MFYLKQFYCGDYEDCIMQSGIYKITFVGCSHCYVGSAMCFSTRWGLHRHQLKLHKHANRALQRTADKYGHDSIRFTILEMVPVKQRLVAREQFWMDALNPALNILKKAGSQLGLKHSIETRAKLSEIMRKRPRSAESIAKWKATMIRVGGFKKSPEWVAKVVAAKAKTRALRELVKTS